MMELDLFLFANDESFTLGAAVAAVSRAMALSEGLVVHCHLVLRDADAVTQDWAAQSLDQSWTRLESPGPSLAAARNLARASAKAPLVAFVDGHDLWCADWLQRAVAAARKEAAIWRPEFLITFAHDTLAQEAYSVVTQPDGSRHGVLLAPGSHLAGFLAPLLLLQAEPWPAEDAERGWGLPDAWWSYNLAAHGHVHRILPGSFHYRRVPRNVDVTTHRGPMPAGAKRIGPTSSRGIAQRHQHQARQNVAHDSGDVSTRSNCSGAGSPDRLPVAATITSATMSPPTAALHALFDAEWYRSRQPECAKGDAWAFFLEQGLAAEHNPNPLFDSAWYRHRYGAVVPSNLSAVEDWLMRGLAARRDPGPLFSTAWYLDHYPDVAAASVNPLVHYLNWGWKEKRDPSPVFDSAWYFVQYPHAEASGLDACRHFLAEGATRNYSPCRLFNTAWYRRHYGSMLEGGQNPLLHYLEQGAAAGLDPSTRFSTRQYLAAHSELQKSGENPLVHWLAQHPNREAVDVISPHVVRPSSGAVSEVRAVISALGAIEPELVEMAEKLDSLPAVVPMGTGTLAWRRLYVSLRALPRAVVLAGGAEAAQELAAIAGLLILVTESETLEHEAMAVGADWRCLAELEDGLDMAARLRVVVGLVNGLRPAAVLVAGSATGWEMLSRHGTALARHSALFATDAPSSVGGMEQLLQRHLRNSIRALSALYGKDPKKLRLLAREYGLPPSFAIKLQPAAALFAQGGFLATAHLAA